MVGRLGCNRNNLDSCMQARKGYALVPLIKLLKSKKALFFSSATFIKGTSASLYCYVSRTAMFPELHLGYCCAACYCCAFFLLTPSRDTCFFCKGNNKHACASFIFHDHPSGCYSLFEFKIEITILDKKKESRLNFLLRKNY